MLVRWGHRHSHSLVGKNVNCDSLHEGQQKAIWQKFPRLKTTLARLPRWTSLQVFTGCRIYSYIFKTHMYKIIYEICISLEGNTKKPGICLYRGKLSVIREVIVRRIYSFL